MGVTAYFLEISGRIYAEGDFLEEVRKVIFLPKFKSVDVNFQL